MLWLFPMWTQSPSETSDQDVECLSFHTFHHDYNETSEAESQTQLNVIKVALVVVFLYSTKTQTKIVAPLTIEPTNLHFQFLKPKSIFYLSFPWPLCTEGFR